MDERDFQIEIFVIQLRWEVRFPFLGFLKSFILLFHFLGIQKTRNQLFCFSLVTFEMMEDVGGLFSSACPTGEGRDAD